MVDIAYQHEEVIAQINKAFTKNNPSHVLLESFFSTKDYAEVVRLVNQAKKKVVRIPHKYSYTEMKNASLTSLFRSVRFKKFLRHVTNRKIGKINVEIKQFAHKDYTLIHDDQKHSERLVFFFLIPSTSSWDKDSGGNIVVQLNKGQDSMSFTPHPNSLVLFVQGKHDYDFVQYLNNHVGKEKLTVIKGIVG